MVHVVGGYPMTWDDAKAWALRHWPDIDIYEDDLLPSIIQRYHKKRGRSITCIPFAINDDECSLLFVVYSKNDPLSAPRKFRRFPETEAALQYKAELFSHEEDKELAEKSQFMTIADPFR